MDLPPEDLPTDHTLTGPSGAAGTAPGREPSGPRIVCSWTLAGAGSGLLLGALFGAALLVASRAGGLVPFGLIVGGVLGAVSGVLVGALVGVVLLAARTSPRLGRDDPGRRRFVATVAGSTAGVGQAVLGGVAFGAGGLPLVLLLCVIPALLAAGTAAALSRRLPPGRPLAVTATAPPAGAAALAAD